MTDLSELIAWIGWAITAGAWAAPRVLALVRRASLPADTTGRHRLDTWTALLLSSSGEMVRRQHGRGPRPASLVWRGVTYVYHSTHTADPSVGLYRSS